ncbi:hypothetical protein [Methanorbis rubei]|uniref:Uncharacterized protein n=1 Tax=Methanorbis rubei TaxID=3028300 RepID=A0AAE4MHQ1_9EURY|nr:hypothetical protein [Methanocorpusculaceae archaeon Cs1]
MMKIPMPRALKQTSASLIKSGATSQTVRTSQSGSVGAKEAAVKITRSFGMPAAVGAGAGIGIAAAGAGTSSALGNIGKTGSKGVAGIIMIAGLALIAVYAVPKLMQAVK